MPPLRVVVSRRGHFEQEVGWPSHWRLPQTGESIVLPDGSGGWVEWVGWDLAAGVVRVTVR